MASCRNCGSSVRSDEQDADTGLCPPCVGLVVRKARDRIVERLRARATSEEVNVERCRVAGDPRMRERYEHAAAVLREECDRLEKGV